MDKKTINTRKRNIILVGGVILFLLSCSGKETPPSSAPSKTARMQPPAVQQQKVITVEIQPQDPRVGTTLIAKVKGINGNVTYKWYQNNELLEETGNTLNTTSMTKGDQIRVEISYKGKTVSSEPVQLQNSPPIITGAYLLPSNPVYNSIITAHCTGEDPDGDDIEIKYQWYKNGELLTDEIEETLKGPFKKGDTIEVVCIPYDGESNGVPIRRSLTIKDAPPEVNENLKAVRIEENTLTARVIAKDPDGDPLMFSLKEAPEGMSISDDGTITWPIPEDFKGGTVEATVVVSDPEGAETQLSFTLNLKRRT